MNTPGNLMERNRITLSGAQVKSLGAGLVFLLLVIISYQIPWAREYPEDWIIPVKEWLNRFMKWLLDEATFGLFTFKDLTRSFSWLLNWPLQWAKFTLSSGWPLPFTEARLPNLSWVALVAIVALIGHAIQGTRLALLGGLCFAYLAVFGQWQSAMQTLVSILVTVPVGAVLGLSAGILASRSERVKAAIIPVLDIMQTVPVFAYLVPTLLMFGFGPVSAVVATIIYAVPPMVRCTLQGLQQVPDELMESGTAAGCTQNQLLWKVQFPSARPIIMVGINQVIMLSLNMVIIASMIGAGGLGYDVLNALRRQAIGAGLEAGLAIVVMAITLDRFSQAFALKTQQPSQSTSVFLRHWRLLTAIALVLLTMALSPVFPQLMVFPDDWAITTGPYWDALVKWINVNFYDNLSSFKIFLLIYILKPVKVFLLQTPWLALFSVVVFLAWLVGRTRLALGIVGLLSFILVTGSWEKAMITVYLCGLAVMFSALIGIPIGIWTSDRPWASRILAVVLDTLQTLPAFIYLIPVVMLFSVGDFSAMIAVVAYAIVPAIRYTDHGFRNAPPTIVEAARASGCTPMQIMWKVKLPLALPDIMLGINQTVMMALSMLVITALVGTRDLGQEVYIALTKADTGRGLVAGLSVAAIAMVADRIIQRWAATKKAQLGLAG